MGVIKHIIGDFRGNMIAFVSYVACLRPLKFCVYIIFALFFLNGEKSYAQQQPLYTLYPFNVYRYNQAYAGFDNSLSITGSIRKQWDGFDNAPSSQLINAHFPLYALSAGAGIQFESDQSGPEKKISGLVSYNYVISAMGYGLLSLGGSVGFMQKSIDGRLLRTPDGNYEPGVIDHNDTKVPNELVRGSTPFANIGIFFANNMIETGLSVENLVSGKIKSSDGSFEYDPDRVYNLGFSYIWKYDEDLIITPSLMLRTDLRQTQLEVFVKTQIKNNIYFGLSLRGYNRQTIDALNFIAGYRFNKNWTLLYSYDLSLSGLRKVNSGSHEILINYNLAKPIGLSKLPPVIYNTRYF